MTEQWGKYLSINQVAKYTGMSLSYMYQNYKKIVHDNKIRCFKLGERKILLLRDDVDKWMKRQQVIIKPNQNN